MDKNFCPVSWHGIPSEFTRSDVYPWVTDLPIDKKIYCAFWQNWATISLPPEFDFYIISYHTENVNLDWLKDQRSKIDGKFIILFPGNSYSYHLPNTEFISYNDWHQDIDKIFSWHGTGVTQHQKKFKFSAVSNRITQSKIWVTTKLLECNATDYLILHNPFYLQEKNVHLWQKTGNLKLDELTEIYLKKYRNLQLSDEFDSKKDNFQKINSNPWQPQYTETALHFTNGSFHYSYMQNDDQAFIYPGPDIDEKTLKCLIAGIPFIACGQFEIYRTLSRLGFEFDYGFDLSWDDDPGNLTRFEKICDLIDYLSQYSIDDIQEMTKRSTTHNTEFISKRGFYARGEQDKKMSIEKIFACLETN